MVAVQSYLAPFAPRSTHAVDHAVCDRLLGVALGRGGDYADLFFEYRVGAGFTFEEGIQKTASRDVTMGMGVRVQRGDATGFAFVESLDWDAMKRAAETAAQIAQGGGGRERVPLREREHSHRYAFDALSIHRPPLEKGALLERISAAAYAADSRIVKVEASFDEELREILVATSDGTWAFDQQPLLRVGVKAIAERDDKRREGSSGGGGRVTMAYFEGNVPEFHGREAARQAVLMLDAREAPAGEMAVVLAPGSSGILLHEAVGHGLEADFNQQGTSKYSGQVGHQVASPLCTVVDDATIVQSRGSLNVDDEGHEPGRSMLIEDGRLVGYMHDRLSAEHFRLPPSGNGRRESFSTVPMPRMTNTLLLAGPHDPEEIVASTKRGVFAKKFGAGQVDIANGDFVFSVTESFLIEDGKLTAPLKGVHLIGNGPEMLRRVTMLGGDLEVSDGLWTCDKEGQSVPVGVGCPTVKIDQITVGGTKIG